MERNRIVFAISLIVLLVLATISAVFIWKGEERERDDFRVEVVTSFYPLAYLVEEIGGPHVRVVNLTPPGVESHDFEPTLRDLARMEKVDIFFYNGAGLEPWVPKFLSGGFGYPHSIVNMSEGIAQEGTLLIHEGNTIDPHIWLDPAIFFQQALLVREALIKADPERKPYYDERTNILLAKLEILDGDFLQGLQECLHRDIIVSHKAFGYMARAYGLVATSIAGISPDEEPSAKALADLVALAREKNINHIFFESSENVRLSETIAREVAGETLVLHTLESLTLEESKKGENYITIMYKNLANLRTALQCH